MLAGRGRSFTPPDTLSPTNLGEDRLQIDCGGHFLDQDRQWGTHSSSEQELDLDCILGGADQGRGPPVPRLADRCVESQTSGSGGDLEMAPARPGSSRER